MLSFAFDIRGEYYEKKCEISGECPRSEVNEIRSNLANVMSEHRQSWFSISQLNNTEKVVFPFNENIDDEIQISFGSLLSTSTFLIHETPLSNRTRWAVTCRDEKTLLIECQTDQISNSTVRFALPMQLIHKAILVIDHTSSTDVILSTDTITADVRITGSTKESRSFTRISSINCSSIYCCLDCMAMIQ